MKTNEPNVYFVLKGADFDPNELTKRLGIEPTNCWKKGDKGKYNPFMGYSCWELSTQGVAEPLPIDKLVGKIISHLNEKIETINQLKNEFDLYSVLEIVLYIDTNPEVSTPELRHSLSTIEFLCRTGTILDVDIYRYDSTDSEE
ncbi:MAG: DUF4279 domain-containing protein [Flavobacteriales bacterium]|nr:DUF4279 domain-containing protein [Flavobacteriales bacterium]